MLNVAYITLGEYPGKVPSQWLIGGLESTHGASIPAFRNVATGMGLDVNELSGSVCTDDFDNDGFLDIFISSWAYTHPLRFFHNNGDGTFTERTEQLGLEGINGGLNMVSADYNNDGFLDVYVMRGAWLGDAGIIPNSLIRNNGDGTFEDVTFASGLLSFHPSQAASWADFNNDGFPDFYLGTGAPDLRSVVPNLTFYNHGGERFEDITYRSGMGHIQKGHGIAFADLDNDGDQDIYTVMGGAYQGDFFYNALFENPNEVNSWVTLKLEGTTSNRAAIGARIKVSDSNASGRQQDYYALVSTGGSFGCSSLQQEMGLGDATTIDRIEITWPNREKSIQYFNNVPINKRYHIREGEKKLSPMNQAVFTFKPEEGHHHHH